MAAINKFDGEYRWLSNFYPCAIHVNGLLFPSVEHAYQAAKYPPDEREQFLTKTAGQAKRMGAAAQLPNGWHQMKVSIMREMLEVKFREGSLLAHKLIATGNTTLEEGNDWGDTFWGTCGTKGGSNHLGKLLMERRAILNPPLFQFLAP